jgi:hypothetical protein
MCQKNVTTTTTTTTTDATIIPVWTQLIVTLCYNNLVSNNLVVLAEKFLLEEKCKFSNSNKRRSAIYTIYFAVTDNRKISSFWTAQKKSNELVHPAIIKNCESTEKKIPRFLRFDTCNVTYDNGKA